MKKRRPENPRLGAMALTEPGAGSDVKAIQTRAVRDGDEWVINGRKCFITNGGIADLYVVFAKAKPPFTPPVALFRKALDIRVSGAL